MTLTAAQSQFVESVLDLKPRLATFDCDGTLWSGDAGEGFFSWELAHGFVAPEVVRWARARYAEYKAGNVPEDVMCGEMVTMHRGMREEVVQKACDDYFPEAIGRNVFAEMRDLVHRLRDSGCEVWAVSSSNQWIIRSGMRTFGIPNDHILSAEVAIDSGTISDRLIRVPSGHGKVEAIRSVLQSPPDCAFGNAIWDREMLQLARHGYAVNPNPNLKEIAMAKHWTIYQPDLDHHSSGSLPERTRI